MASTRKDVETRLHAGTSQGLLQQLASLVGNLSIKVSMLDQEWRVVSRDVCNRIRRIGCRSHILNRPSEKQGFRGPEGAANLAER